MGPVRVGVRVRVRVRAEVRARGRGKTIFRARVDTPLPGRHPAPA